LRAFLQYHFEIVIAKMPMRVKAFVLALASLGGATPIRNNPICVAPTKEAKSITNTVTIVGIIAISL
jgi:hypothetical protein